MTLTSFVMRLQSDMFIACVCGRLIARGDVVWDVSRQAWALRCFYCGAAAVRPAGIDAPREAQTDA